MKIILPIAVISTLLGGAFGAQAQTKLPDLKKQATAQAVLDEHFAALNACDWNRLLAQYPEDAQINLPNGVIVKGRAALGDLFAGFCKDAKDGGLNGIQFTVEHSTTIENTFATQWVATAPFLAEPYRGSDAYITHDGYMQGNGHHVRWRRSQDEEIGAGPARGRTANKATAIAERSAVASENCGKTNARAVVVRWNVCRHAPAIIQPGSTNRDCTTATAETVMPELRPGITVTGHLIPCCHARLVPTIHVCRGSVLRTWMPATRRHDDKKRHCEERSDEAIHSRFAEAGLLRSARNDSETNKKPRGFPRGF